MLCAFEAHIDPGIPGPLSFGRMVGLNLELIRIADDEDFRLGKSHPRYYPDSR